MYVLSAICITQLLEVNCFSDVVLLVYSSIVNVVAK
jgi:hypothetical protein